MFFIVTPWDVHYMYIYLWKCVHIHTYTYTMHKRGVFFNTKYIQDVNSQYYSRYKILTCICVCHPYFCVNTHVTRYREGSTSNRFHHENFSLAHETKLFFLLHFTFECWFMWRDLQTQHAGLLGWSLMHCIQDMWNSKSNIL
jgi:hypothetical protein